MDWTQVAQKVQGGKYFGMYFIPKGTELFRGDIQWYDKCKHGSSVYTKGGPSWFGTQRVAEIYGPAIRFKTRENLYLLAMDDINTLNKLRGEFTGKPVLRSLNESFNIFDDGIVKYIQRISDSEHDYKIAREICEESGVPGWAHLTMRDDTSKGTFHAEIVLCDAKYVQCTGVIEYSTAEFLRLQATNMANIAKREQKARGKPKLKLGGEDLPSDIPHPLSLVPKKLF